MGTPAAGHISYLEFNHDELEGAQDITYDIQVAGVDVTKKSSAGWEESIPGNGGMTIQGTCVYEEDEASQAAMIADTIAKTEQFCKWSPLAFASANDTHVGHGNFDSNQQSSPTKEAVSFPFGFKFSGAPRRKVEYSTVGLRMHLRSLDIDGNGEYSDDNSPYADGDFIGDVGAEWEDTGALGNSFVNTVGDAVRPYYDTNQNYGAPGVRFTGAGSEYLVSDGAASTYKLFHDGTDFSMYILLKMDSTYTSAQQPIFATMNVLNTQTGFILHRVGTTNVLQLHIGNSGGTGWVYNLASTITAPVDEFILIQVIHDEGGAGDDMKVYINDTEVITQAAVDEAVSAGDPASPPVFNSNASKTTFGQHVYLAFQAYNIAHSAAAQAAHVQALKDDFGVKLETVPT